MISLSTIFKTTRKTAVFDIDTLNILGSFLRPHLPYIPHACVPISVSMCPFCPCKRPCKRVSNKDANVFAQGIQNCQSFAKPQMQSYPSSAPFPRTMCSKTNKSAKYEGECRRAKSERGSFSIYKPLNGLFPFFGMCLTPAPSLPPSSFQVRLMPFRSDRQTLYRTQQHRRQSFHLSFCLRHCLDPF